MANDLIQRKYYIVDTEDSLPSEIVDGSIYYVKGNNALYIDMSNTRRRINPDYSNKLDANQGSINAGKSLSIDDNGNVIPVENINIDPTFKNQGQAADAKITGQALGQLYDYFEDLQQIIENLDDSTTVTTDTTLSNQGVPADAKATGDRLTSIQSELNVLEPTATASDVGKTLKVKTVANGKVSKYELGDMMIDNTLTQSGWAADAKKVGSELSSVKDEVRNESQARTTADNALREDINDDLAQIQAQISSVYGAPSTASTVAQMTDHTKAYVYTGEESGYVTGNWYYWNGSSWVSGGVYNAVAVQTDKSLTLDGKAADAKTVGDELSGLKDDLYIIEDVIFLAEKVDIVPDSYFNTVGVFKDGETTYYKGETSYMASSGTYCKRIAVSPGETYKIYGVGGSNAIGLYILTRNDKTIISSEKNGSRDNPITLRITEGGYLYVNLYGYNPATDKVTKITGTVIEGIKDKVEKPWNGKTVVIFGDSISEFADNDGKRYSDYLQDLTGATIINCGIGGTQLRQRETPTATPTNITEGYAGIDIVNMVISCCNNNFTIAEACAEYIKTTQGDDNTEIVARAKAIDWNNVDAVIVLGGTNDWNNGHYLGTDSDTTADTTLGAINIIIQSLLSTFTHIKLYWFTPLVRWLASSLSERTPANWAGNAKNGREHVTLPAYVDAIINRVKAESIPVCDMYYTLGWNMCNFSAYFNDNDGTHPRKGNKEIAHKIYAFIMANKTF